MARNEASARAVAAINHLIAVAAGNGSGGATEAYNGVDDVAYALSQIPLFSPRPIKIICVGAGFSGLSIAHAVSSGRLPAVELKIYEKNAGIGGTWYENRYPGYAIEADGR